MELPLNGMIGTTASRQRSAPQPNESWLICEQNTLQLAVGETNPLNVLLGGYTSRPIPGRTVTAGCPKAKGQVRRASLTHAQVTAWYQKLPNTPWSLKDKCKVSAGKQSILTRTEAIFPGDFPEISQSVQREQQSTAYATLSAMHVSSFILTKH